MLFALDNLRVGLGFTKGRNSFGFLCISHPVSRNDLCFCQLVQTILERHRAAMIHKIMITVTIVVHC